MTNPQVMPSYLYKYSDLYGRNPRLANKTWFKEARLGLFIHYGLYSLVGEGEWVQYNRPIRVSEYEKLADRFSAEKFDAEAVTDLALAMKANYITFTTRHHDSFCLFSSRETGFTSVDSTAGRDLTMELAEACKRKQLGLFLYYSHGRDWKHPHAPGNEGYCGGNTKPRPLYDPPEPSYKTGDQSDLNIYLRFVFNQCMELIERYPTAAGIWFDGIGVPMIRGDISAFRCQELYDAIHTSSPHMLIAYKQGLLGTEDFFSLECRLPPRAHIGEGLPWRRSFDAYDPAVLAEACLPMNTAAWGYCRRGEHLTCRQVWDKLEICAQDDCNLLLNTGPLGDGSLDDADMHTLHMLGEKIQRYGLPPVQYGGKENPQSRKQPDPAELERL